MPRKQKIVQLLDEAWRTRGDADYERGKRLVAEAAGRKVKQLRSAELK